MGQLHGQVVSEYGEPVPSATVSLEGGKRAQKVDQDGLFAFSRLEPGTHEITAAAEGFAPERITVSLAPGEMAYLQPFELAAGETHLGVVIDARSGEPLPGAAVRSVTLPGLVSTETDSQGEFSVVLPPSLPVELEFSSANYATQREIVDAGSWPATDGAKEFALSRGGWIKVTIWDETTNGPCLACSAVIVPRRSGSTSAAGLLTNVDGQAVSEPLASGTYDVMAEDVRNLGSAVTVSGGRETKIVEVASEQTSAVTFGLHRTDVTIRLMPSLTGEWLLHAKDSRKNQLLRQEPDGSYVAQKAEDDSLLIYLKTEQFETWIANLETEDRRNEVLIRLPLTEVVASLVDGNNYPLPRTRVEIVNSNGGLVAVTNSAADGSVMLKFLHPGNYTLTVSNAAAAAFNVSQASRRLDIGHVTVLR
jgi:hypothetical protein